ncbi:MAG: hypothetical protein MZV64_01500 [Ignavibacteriales bacterium]|nr:hypothetical protein [Ignavibacteriales bacterium]
MKVKKVLGQSLLLEFPLGRDHLEEMKKLLMKKQLSTDVILNPDEVGMKNLP